MHGFLWFDRKEQMVCDADRQRDASSSQGGFGSLATRNKKARGKVLSHAPMEGAYFMTIIFLTALNSFTLMR